MKNLIVYPPITSHQYYALPLSIIGSDIKLRNWIYSEFIQLYTFRDREDERMHVRLYNNKNEMYLYEPLHGTGILPKQLTNGSNIISVYKILLNDGQYILDFVDHFYIKSFNIDEHYMHDVLIYGYDDERQVLHAYAYHGARLSEFDIPYIEYEEAYNSEFQLSQFHCMVLYRKKEEVFYANISRIGNHLLDYVNGINTFDRESPNKVELYKPMFGLSVYNELKYNIHYMREWNLNIDIPDMFCIYDHKRFMLERVIYLNNNTAIKCPYDLMNKFTEIANSGRIMTMLVMKYNHKRGGQMDYDNLLRRFDGMRELEKIAFTEYYEYNRSAFENS